MSGVTIELSYALLQAVVINQLCEIRRQCTANGMRMDTSEASCVFNADTIEINKTHEAVPITQKDTWEKLFFEEKHNAMERRNREWGIRVCERK